MYEPKTIQVTMDYAMACKIAQLAEDDNDRMNDGLFYSDNNGERDTNNDLIAAFGPLTEYSKWGAAE